MMQRRRAGRNGGRAGKPLLLVIGPVPPPAHGVATATKLIVESPVVAAAFDVVHLDTSDRRSVANLNRIDLTNVWLGVLHEAQLVYSCVVRRPEVVYLTLSQGPPGILRDWGFLRIASLFHCRSVAHLRGSGYASVYADAQVWLRCVLSDFFRRADRVIVLGEGLIPMARAVHAAARVGVVPNGCPPVLGGRERSATGPRPTILFLGALKRSKGLHDALRVADRVRAQMPAARFVLAGVGGDAADRRAAEAFVAARGLESCVSFPGAVDARGKAKLFSESSVYLLASHGEGHPWSVIEAMSAGVPVVATRTGAVPDTVVDGVTGFLFDVGDIAGMAAGVTRILTEQALAEAMSLKSRERYEKLFTVEQSHAQLVRELLAALAGGR